MRWLLLITISAALAACSPARTPPNELAFEALEKAAQECAATGKVATDGYCKEVVVVYDQKWAKKKEEERLAKIKAREATMKTDVTVPKF